MRFWRRFKKNRFAVVGLFMVIFLITVAVLAPYISPYDPNEQDLLSSLQGPSWKHPFGVDYFGRDILSRVIWGSRISLTLSVEAVSLATVVGSLIGAVAGFYGGVIDEILMRVMDIFLAIPSILLAIAIVAVLGPSDFNLILAIATYTIPQFARIARGAVLSEKNREYVEAAKAVGERGFIILFRYIMPNALPPIVVQATLRMAASIMSIAGLGFLGLGVQPPTPEWGTDISLARTYIEIAPHAGIFPGLAIFLSVMAFNFLGDGLNEALNPSLKDR